MADSLIPRRCPVCEGSSAPALFQKGPLHLVRCRDCRMIFVNPVEAGWINGDHYDQLARPFYLSPDKLESDYAPVRFQRELRIFRRFCSSGAVLDVGCSTGAFLHQLQVRFPGAYDVVGTDVSGPAVDYAEQRGVRVLRESFLTDRPNLPKYAAITFWAVLEHLGEPRRFLARAAEQLLPGGHCFLLVPNFSSLAVRLLGAKYRYIFPQHLNYFTAATLRTLAASQPSLRVVHETTTHFNPLVIAQDWRRDGQFVPDEDRARLLKRTTGFKTNPLLQPARWLLAAVEAGLGSVQLADNCVLVLQKTGD
jgi:2-polyprenyl-3-methyl-5-hydroxy-6-metoxy-1,4-benzoquinol methylase